MSRCSYSRQAFGIRFEEKAKGQWMANWAFAVKETYAKKEGYDHNTIVGTFTLDTAYPGCPYCQTKSIFKCGCGKVNCWDRKTNTVTCSWCNQTGEINGQIETLSAGEDY
jgi:TerY-C metal binding domain